jgi:DNA-nicking Smr family endonuclease
MMLAIMTALVFARRKPLTLMGIAIHFNNDQQVTKMTNPKNRPKSLKEQLAPLKAQLKVDDNKPEKKPQPPKATSAKATPPMNAPVKAPPTPVSPAVRVNAAPPKNSPEPIINEKVTDADMVEFWRAAAGTVAVAKNGREVQAKKPKPSKSSEPLTVAPTVVDKENFADLLDLSESTMKQALFEKDSEKPAPSRAISSKRVELMGLAAPQAKERLLRFLKAAKGRGERAVLVVFGPDFMLKAAVEEALEGAHGSLVRHQTDAGEPMAFKVFLI